MSVTVKVQFNDKLFKLAANVNTIQQVNKQMALRYPYKIPHLAYYHEGNVIENLESLIESLRRAGKNSVKMEARIASQLVCEKSDISFISIHPNEEVAISKIEQKSEQIQKWIAQYEIPKQFYTCYNCKGKGIYEESSLNNLCQICKGRGEFDNNHKYVKHMKELYQMLVKPKEVKSVCEERLQEICTQEQMIFKQMLENPTKMKFGHLSKDYQMNIVQVTKIDKMEIGVPFTYQFQVHNLGNDLPNFIELVDCDSKQNRLVKTLKSGEKMIVEVGPFVCADEKLLQKFFYLCFRIGDKWCRLGYKFGFRVRGTKKVVVKKLEASNRQRIRDLKSMSGSKKSEQYLEIALKSMGIDVSSLEMEQELILEIIQQIQ